MDIRAGIQRGIDYIEENLKTEISAGELAELAGFSLFHYYRLFQAAVGMPVMAYITRRRLLWAAYEMNRGMGRREAAYSYGFDTPAGLYKAFRREFGCTPAEFMSRFPAGKPGRVCLTQEEHIMITHKSVKEILKNWNLQDQTITAAANSGGVSENAFFIGENHVLKVFAVPAKAQLSAEMADVLAEAGLSGGGVEKTAEGQAVYRDGALSWVMTRRMEGRSIRAEQLYSKPGLARYLGEVIGQLHQVLQNRTDILCETRDIFAEVRDSWLDVLEPARQKEYLEIFGGLQEKLPRQIIHRDLNPSNILMGEETVAGFVDFDLTQKSIRIFDPCYAATAVLSETFRDHKSEWLSVYREILTGYDAVAHLAEAERKAVPYVLLSIQMICTGWFRTQEKYQELARINDNMLSWMLENWEDLQY